jgi:hypothetical protein
LSTKKRIEITVETERVWFTGQRRSALPVWCAECPEPMVTALEAAAVAGVDSRLIYLWVAAEALHFTETHEGRLPICLNSLPKHQESSNDDALKQ